MLEKNLLLELVEFVEIHQSIHPSTFYDESYKQEELILENIHQIELEDYIKNNRKPTLNQVLFHYIDRKGANDAYIYKKAGLDRRHFSKIRSNPTYRPKKNTLIALALALQLNKEETEELLGSAGYSLSDSETNDLVIQFCLEKGIYDIHLVNEALDYFDMKPLIG